jgi:hypothetical protein
MQKRFLMERPDGRRPLGTPRLDARVILKWVFKKWGGRHGLD